MLTAASRWRVGLIVGYSIAISATSLRLVHRAHRKQLYWDDFWAFLALIMGLLIFMLYMFLPANQQRADLLPVLQYSVSIWLQLFSHATALWTTRLSVAVTIVRIVPQGRTKTISRATGFAFFLMWLAVVIQRIFICGITPLQVPICQYTRLTGILELITDVLADVWLFLWSVGVVFCMRLQWRHMRLLFACFSGALIASTCSIVHAIYILRNDIFLIGVTAHVQIAVYLFFCNVLVLAAWLYRVCLSSHSVNASSRTFSTIPEEVQEFDSVYVLTTHRKARPPPEARPTWDVSIARLSKLGSTFNKPQRSNNGDRSVECGSSQETKDGSSTSRLTPCSESHDNDTYGIRTERRSKTSLKVSMAGVPAPGTGTCGYHDSLASRSEQQEREQQGSAVTGIDIDIMKKHRSTQSIGTMVIIQLPQSTPGMSEKETKTSGCHSHSDLQPQPHATNIEPHTRSRPFMTL